MKEWFRQKLHNFIFPADEPMINTTIAKQQTIDCDPREHASIEFTVMPANGGRVVSTRRWDHKKDQWVHKLHIITEQEDFGEEIKNIVFMEDLSR